MRQVWLVVGSAILTVGCASAPPDGSEVPVLAEVGTETMPLDLEAVVASPMALQAVPAARAAPSARGVTSTALTAAAVLAPWLATMGVPLAVIALVGLVGLLCFEHAYVQAGQSVPLA